MDCKRCGSELVDRNSKIEIRAEGVDDRTAKGYKCQKCGHTNYESE